MQRIDNGTYLTPSETDLRDLYEYPAGLEAPCIRLNFVASIDGAATDDGKSAGLGTPADKHVFEVLRDLTDAVLVGSGTARAENYGGVVVSDEARAWRVAHDRAAVPPIVVVTSSANVDPTSKLVTGAEIAPIVVTLESAPTDRIRALRDAGATVITTPGETVGSHDIRDALADAGLMRILCEGGPSLFGQLLDDDMVDELCVTTSPTLVAGDAGRIARSSTTRSRPMRPAHILTDDDGTILVRWVREHPGTAKA
ncbi:pyrimidine reductase family protein [Rhodococcoides trifolii]|uniref:pyrimidine reductase family protein n=1 Tax=Rhodococcoides trifolii TaxID=908250 RepID=UPI00352FFA1E